MDNVPRPAVRSIGAAGARVVLQRRFGEKGDCPNFRLSENGTVPFVAARSPSDQKPHIVVVLAEAFIDPRELGLVVEPEPLANFDEAVRRSVYSGRACVPVYGGWTVRSEYSLLTGIDAAAFANNIGNPNSTFVSPATHSLAKHLKSHGYRTAIVHPYDRRFYGRGNVSASLGFDDFLDEASFAPRGSRGTIYLRRGRRGKDRRGTPPGCEPDVPVLRYD